MQLRIKEIAKKKGITMKKIAEELNTSPAMITYYEKGNVSAPIDKLQQIAEILNCEISELIPTSDKYAHFYDKDEYLGIRKK